MASLPNTVCSTPSNTRPAFSVPTRSYLDKNNDTSELPSVDVTTLNGSITDCKQNWIFSLVSRSVTLTPIHEGTRTTRPSTSIW